MLASVLRAASPRRSLAGTAGLQFGLGTVHRPSPPPAVAEHVTKRIKFELAA